MDGLKLKLSTRFMKSIITNLISKFLLKKYGYNIDILINEIEIESENGKIHIHADVEADVDNDEFLKIVKTIGMD